MLSKASIGAFLNLAESQPEQWAADVQALEELPLAHLELWLEHAPRGRELAVLDSFIGDWRRIMHGPFIGMSLATAWDELASLSLDRCHRAIEAAALLRCEVVTFHAGHYAAFGSHSAALKRVAGRLERFARLSFPSVAVENLPGRGGAAPEAVTRSGDFDTLGVVLQDLCFTLDVGHCLENGEDPVAEFTARAGRIRNIHLHDGAAGGGSHRALGNGELDLASLLSALDAHDYGGFLTLETLTRADLERSLEALAVAGVRGRPRALRTAA